ncbi:NAD(P)H-dependent oxidoreductase [Microbacterium sp. W1N]|uniref:NADPH-dependent FMN reductase n=1 Tax=Microbacterium festucae TaxID=2977531 RepID=UPI0021C1E225|nr:NADPH-dependent FMN reductase [Microbacterium festucae]MCT9819650.1 NAD(P)H-dependent oxidoreductase [Microbacterium festucae]
MATYTVGILVGSASEPSLNRRFADALVRLGADVGLEFTDIPIVDLPFFGTQYEADFPPVGQRFKTALDAVDALLFVTPEYNRSIPAVMKNAVDWASRPVGENAFPDKPVAVTGASTGDISTAVAQQELKGILLAQGAVVLGAPEVYIHVVDGFFADNGSVADADTREFLSGFLSRFHQHIRRSRT